MTPEEEAKYALEADPDCKQCWGTGIATYGDTSLGLGGIGGQTITAGPCRCTATWQAWRRQ